MSTKVRAACDECGWVSKWMASRAYADHAFTRHSCKRQRTRTARKHRVARRLARSGPVRECEHKIANHQHGTHAAYVLDRCKCKPCREANRAYEHQRAKDRVMGKQAYVDAAPAREHVRALTGAGMGLKRVAEVSGVAHGALWKLMYGKRQPDGTQQPSKRIRPETEAALLAVTADLDRLAGGAKVEATGAVRRLRALVALGYPGAELARRLTLTGAIHDRQPVDRLLHGQALVSAATARAVAVLYDQLGVRAPHPSTHAAKIAVARSLNRARTARWAPPGAWFDDEIDNPRSRPIPHPDSPLRDARPGLAQPRRSTAA